MTLLVTLFLVLINIFTNITTNSPNVEGLTSISAWVITCILFVFGALLGFTGMLFKKNHLAKVILDSTSNRWLSHHLVIPWNIINLFFFYFTERLWVKNLPQTGELARLSIGLHRSDSHKSFSDRFFPLQRHLLADLSHINYSSIFLQDCLN